MAGLSAPYFGEKQTEYLVPPPIDIFPRTIQGCRLGVVVFQQPPDLEGRGDLSVTCFLPVNTASYKEDEHKSTKIVIQLIGGCMRLIRISLVTMIVFSALLSMYAQDYSKFNFVVGGGPGFPQGDMSSFVSTGGHFMIGGGVNFNKFLGVDTEFMWHDLPINSSTLQLLQTPGASARQYAWTFNPIVHVPFGAKLGAYVVGGAGWYHRSGETTTPGVGVVCDPYWSWWYGCTIGSVNFVTGSRSANAFGENIGGGLTYRLGESHAKIFTEIRYHHAGYNHISTNLLPLTFGIRW